MLNKSETKNYKIGDLLACFDNETDQSNPILGMITNVVSKYDHEENRKINHYYVLWVDEVIEFHYYDVSAYEKVLSDILSGYVEDHQYDG